MEKERATAVVVLLCLVVVMELPEASATRYMVGGNMGWTSNVNYTIWARDKHFLQWRLALNQMDVIEVNQTNYVSCDAEHPLHNWTTGAGRDVVPLNVTRDYYFITSKGYCYGGMKLAVKVENMPPPPEAAPVKSKSSDLTPAFGSQFVLPAVFAIGTMWDVLVRCERM